MAGGDGYNGISLCTGSSRPSGIAPSRRNTIESAFDPCHCPVCRNHFRRLVRWLYGRLLGMAERIFRPRNGGAHLLRDPLSGLEKNSIDRTAFERCSLIAARSTRLKILSDIDRGILCILDDVVDALCLVAQFPSRSPRPFDDAERIDGDAVPADLIGNRSSLGRRISRCMGQAICPSALSPGKPRHDPRRAVRLDDLYNDFSVCSSGGNCRLRFIRRTLHRESLQRRL